MTAKLIPLPKPDPPQADNAKACVEILEEALELAKARKIAAVALATVSIDRKRATTFSWSSGTFTYLLTATTVLKRRLMQADEEHNR